MKALAWSAGARQAALSASWSRGGDSGCTVRVWGCNGPVVEEELGLNQAARRQIQSGSAVGRLRPLGVRMVCSVHERGRRFGVGSRRAGVRSTGYLDGPQVEALRSQGRIPTSRICGRGTGSRVLAIDPEQHEPGGVRGVSAPVPERGCSVSWRRPVWRGCVVRRVEAEVCSRWARIAASLREPEELPSARKSRRSRPRPTRSISTASRAALPMRYSTTRPADGPSSPRAVRALTDEALRSMSNNDGSAVDPAGAVAARIAVPGALQAPRRTVGSSGRTRTTVWPPGRRGQPVRGEEPLR